MGLLLTALMLTGCLPSDGKPEGAFVIGRKGLDPGHFIQPRAVAVDEQDNLFVVDKTGRIQRFDLRGKFVKGWRTPKVKSGKPAGLGISNDGMLMVADTHYFRVLFYTIDGELIPERTIGGVNGRGEGEFGYVTDVAQDSKGNYYVGEYGGFDRIQVFSPEGVWTGSFGSAGAELGQFLRPQGFVIDDKDQMWVADSSNHRVQVFDLNANPIKPLFEWGSFGDQPGQMKYPFGIELDDEGGVYVVEYGGHRIQKFNSTGKYLGVFGGKGKLPGQFSQPWAVEIDSEGALNVADKYNDRVQRFFFPKQSED